MSLEVSCNFSLEISTFLIDIGSQIWDPPEKNEKIFFGKYPCDVDRFFCCAMSCDTALNFVTRSWIHNSRRLRFISHVQMYFRQQKSVFQQQARTKSDLLRVEPLVARRLCFALKNLRHSSVSRVSAHKFKMSTRGCVENCGIVTLLNKEASFDSLQKKLWGQLLWLTLLERDTSRWST